MKSATVVCGSADAEGVTKGMCDSAREALVSYGYEVRTFMVSEMDIGHCRDCGGCADGCCIIDDDMSRIYDSLASSEILVLATPLHFSSPSSLLKTVMDRLQPYWHNKGLAHPEYCIGLMCGGSREPFFEVTERIFRSFCLTMGMRYLGGVKIPDTDSGNVDPAPAVKVFLNSIIEDKGLWRA
jgi:multimeric flavodoxin WrbA